MTISIGEVIAVNGIRITLYIHEESNLETIFFEGQKYKGISIREHIAIKRGFRDIVCLVEGEYLDESRLEKDGNKTNYVRKVEVKPIGYFENEYFYEGVKFLPMIKDSAFLMSEDKITKIYSKNNNSDFVIGNLLKEEVPISLPWDKIFNTHIGIFGNTGSGKSNTLAKIFTVLFDKKIHEINGNSNFVILDFNGEYTGSQIISENKFKTTLNLTTNYENGDKFLLNVAEFWNVETLSVLFQATTQTQRPFLKRITIGKERFKGKLDCLQNYIKKTFEYVFTAASPKPETLDILRDITKSLNLTAMENELGRISWHSVQNRFMGNNGSVVYYDTFEKYQTNLSNSVNDIQIGSVSSFNELILRINLQLINDLLKGYVQFEHIQPLLKRIESSIDSLKKVIEVVEKEEDNKLLTVISLRKCNQEMKKILPLLIAKHYYNQHKSQVTNPPNKTMHLIIDEAHNILSQQSSNEHESWKDYRLEMFEEIIKEGRKFGMFLTLASQRPADISPTIVSQLHNFFIHRLVNERDLFLLSNTISTLDNLSKGLIPTLSKGCCIVTGTSFELPMILQINKLEYGKSPDSDDVDLTQLWSKKK